MQRFSNALIRILVDLGTFRPTMMGSLIWQIQIGQMQCQLLYMCAGRKQLEGAASKFITTTQMLELLLIRAIVFLY